MNILDQKFAEFQKLPNGDKVTYFERDGRLFDMVISQQLNRALLDELYGITNRLRFISKSKEGALFLQNLLCHKRAMLYFAQPSSRTYLSFENACHLLGIRTTEIRDARVSSEIKGESFDDSLRTFSSYTDLIIMRHFGMGTAERAAWLLNTFTNRPVPIINGGSGDDQHPTQALLDIYTLQRSFESRGGIPGKHVVFVGDLLRGRTVRSLAQLLTNYEDVSQCFVAPPALQLGEDVQAILRREGVDFTLTDDFESAIADADAVYMTRVQDEWDAHKGDSAKIDISKYSFEERHLSVLKPDGIIMHPLPRRTEIAVEVDRDPRAMYWRQMRNGMWIRAALIATVSGVDGVIRDYPEA